MKEAMYDESFDSGPQNSSHILWFYIVDLAIINSTCIILPATYAHWESTVWPGPRQDIPKTLKFYWAICGNLQNQVLWNGSSFCKSCYLIQKKEFPLREKLELWPGVSNSVYQPDPNTLISLVEKIKAFSPKQAYL